MTDHRALGRHPRTHPRRRLAARARPRHRRCLGQGDRRTTPASRASSSTSTTRNRAGLLLAMARHRDEASDFPRRVAAARELPPVDALETLLRAWCAYLPELLPVARALEAALITGDEGGEVWTDRMDDLHEIYRARARARRRRTADSRPTGRSPPPPTGPGRTSSPAAGTTSSPPRLDRPRRTPSAASTASSQNSWSPPPDELPSTAKHRRSRSAGAQAPHTAELLRSSPARILETRSAP